MENLPLFGPAAPEEGWVPAPRYLLRRRRILHQLRNFPPCDVIEVGCGAGMLLQELSARGFRCQALESSPQARELIARLSVKTGQVVDVHDAANPAWTGRFPLVMAFEVLEHIENDDAAMKQWASWLAPGGTLLLSVPAHPRLWSAADEWAVARLSTEQPDTASASNGTRQIRAVERKPSSSKSARPMEPTQPVSRRCCPMQAHMARTTRGAASMPITAQTGQLHGGAGKIHRKPRRGTGPPDMAPRPEML